MSAFDYARSKATADRLIAKFGQAAVLRRPTSSGTAYNPTPGPPADHLCTLAVLDYALSEIDGERVLQTDKRAYVAKASLAIEPAVTDKLVIGGVEHSIITIRPLNPAGAVVYWECQVRR